MTDYQPIVSQSGTEHLTNPSPSKWHRRTRTLCDFNISHEPHDTDKPANGKRCEACVQEAEVRGIKWPTILRATVPNTPGRMLP